MNPDQSEMNQELREKSFTECWHWHLQAGGSNSSQSALFYLYRVTGWKSTVAHEGQRNAKATTEQQKTQQQKNTT